MADPAETEAQSIDAAEPPVESARGGMPRIGDVVAGRYRIERILGSGGMGVVVEARHTALGELVAIKFLRADARKDPAIAERFLREARASSQLKGEHVARVHDLGTTEAGHAYLVMEHLTGSDLSTLIAERGALPIAEAVNYVLQACEGLAEAHARGIVHRDLKPSNLFLTSSTDRSDLIKLLDFGIAKATTEAPNAIALTETHAVFGSPAYMSPEQIRSAKNVDARTDIWSLGVVLFELLSASIPFQGESSTAVLAAVAADQPTPLRSLRPEVPSELAAVVMRCLEKDPAKRCQTVLELAVELLPFAAGRSTISVERIRRMSLPPPDSRPSFKPSGGSGILTGRAWATTAQAPSTAPPTPETKPRRAMVGVVAVAIVAIGYLGFRATLQRHPLPEATATTAPSAPLLPSAANSAVSPAAPTPVAAAPAAQPTALTSPTPAADAGLATVGAKNDRTKESPRIRHGRPTPAPVAAAAPPSATPAPAAPLDPLQSNAARDMR